MTLSRFLALLPLVALPFAGCSADEGVEPGDFAAACLENGTLTAEQCQCLDAQAVGMSRDSYSFVLAILTDRAKISRLRGSLDKGETSEADQFVVRGIQACLVDLPGGAPRDDRAAGLAVPPENAGAARDASE